MRNNISTNGENIEERRTFDDSDDLSRKSQNKPKYLEHYILASVGIAAKYLTK